MSTIVTRAGKGSPLTNTEVDNNFTNLNTDKLEKDGSNLASKVSFDTTAALTPTTGQMVWDAETGTVDIGLNGATAPVMSVGEDQFYRVINQTGSTITKGTIVMAFGTVGASGVIKVKAWDGSQASKTIMGLVMADIPTEVDPTESGLGYILAFGKLRGIQTNGANYGQTWADGDIIYAGASSGLTNVLPAAPNTKTTVAIVINSHASNGTLFVRPSYGSNLGEDELVQLASLANGDTLIYNSTNSRFENTAFPAGGLTFVVKTANYTTQDKEGVLADTSGGAFTVTLPATPTTGAQVVVADSGSAWGTNNLTVGRNGSTIGGLAENLVCDITGASVQFVYDGSTWEVYAQIGGNGGTAVTLDGTQTLTNKTIDGANNTLSVRLANDVTGTLPVANGGTGATTLTANNVLLGNGTSAPLFVAPGTTGNVLVSNGTTWTSAAPAGGGAWVLLHTTTITSLASFITITSGFSSTYDNYRIHFDGLDSTNTNPVNFEFWLRKGGANKITNYKATSFETADTSINDTTSTQGFIIGKIGNITQTGMYCSGFVEINSANTTSSQGRSQLFQSQMSFPEDSSGTPWLKFLIGNQGDTGVIQGFTVNIGSGDFQAGTIRVYGLKKS